MVLIRHVLKCVFSVTSAPVVRGAPFLIPRRSEYALAGDMVNLAARLAAAAEKGSKGVLCDENTLKGIYGTVRIVGSSCKYVEEL